MWTGAQQPQTALMAALLLLLLLLLLLAGGAAGDLAVGKTAFKMARFDQAPGLEERFYGTTDGGALVFLQTEGGGAAFFDRAQATRLTAFSTLVDDSYGDSHRCRSIEAKDSPAPTTTLGGEGKELYACREVTELMMSLTQDGLPKKLERNAHVAEGSAEDVLLKRMSRAFMGWYLAPTEAERDSLHTYDVDPATQLVLDGYGGTAYDNDEASPRESYTRAVLAALRLRVGRAGLGLGLGFWPRVRSIVEGCWVWVSLSRPSPEFAEAVRTAAPSRGFMHRRGYLDDDQLKTLLDALGEEDPTVELSDMYAGRALEHDKDEDEGKNKNTDADADAEADATVFATTLGIGNTPTLPDQYRMRPVHFVVDSRTGRYLPQISDLVIQSEVVFTSWTSGRFRVLGAEKLWPYRDQQRNWWQPGKGGYRGHLLVLYIQDYERKTGDGSKEEEEEEEEVLDVHELRREADGVSSSDVRAYRRLVEQTSEKLRAEYHKGERGRGVAFGVAS